MICKDIIRQNLKGNTEKYDISVFESVTSTNTLLKEMAERLSQGIPHLRVDFYEANGKIYFGELTFTSGSGFTPFEPEEWDLRFGKWLKLPSKKTI